MKFVCFILKYKANINYISQNQTSPFYGACSENDKTTIENGFGKGN
jgi:hypothetical protein